MAGDPTSVAARDDADENVAGVDHGDGWEPTLEEEGEGIEGRLIRIDSNTEKVEGK